MQIFQIYGSMSSETSSFCFKNLLFLPWYKYFQQVLSYCLFHHIHYPHIYKICKTKKGGTDLLLTSSGLSIEYCANFPQYCLITRNIFSYCTFCLNRIIYIYTFVLCVCYIKTKSYSPYSVH